MTFQLYHQNCKIIIINNIPHQSFFPWPRPGLSLVISVLAWNTELELGLPWQKNCYNLIFRTFNLLDGAKLGLVFHARPAPYLEFSTKSLSKYSYFVMNFQVIINYTMYYFMRKSVLSSSKATIIKMQFHWKLLGIHFNVAFLEFINCFCYLYHHCDLNVL